MARPRKPLALKTGDMKIVDIQKRQQEEEAVKTNSEQLDTPPDWMNETARLEWERLIVDLKKIDILGNLDLNNLAGYCNAYSMYRKASEELEKADLTIKKQTKTGEQIVINPLVDVQKKYAEEMRRFGALCGLTFDSRLKAGIMKVEKQQDEIYEKFGI